MTPEMVMLLRVLLYVISRSDFLAPGREVCRIYEVGVLKRSMLGVKLPSLVLGLNCALVLDCSSLSGLRFPKALPPKSAGAKASARAFRSKGNAGGPP